MAAYVLADVRRTNIEQAARYSEQSGPCVARHGGRFLARGGSIQILEGHWDPERLVIIEFDTMEAARAWYDSDDYCAIRALREGAGDWQMLVVDGLAG